MNATTTLILTLSLFMVLAVGAAGTTDNSSEASETPPSRIAINHNETMLGSSLAIGQAYTFADLLASIQAVFAKPSTGGCDDWGCGMNHNETMLSSPVAIATPNLVGVNGFESSCNAMEL